MENPERIIPNNLLVEVIERVISNFIIPAYNNGIKATGDWGEALEVRVGDKPNSIEIWGADYTIWAESGRAGGKQPPTPKLIRWVEAKFGYSGSKAVSVAWAVANKIKNEGTDNHKNPNNLISLLHTDEVKNYIIKELQDVIHVNVKSIILDAFKQRFK